MSIFAKKDPLEEVKEKIATYNSAVATTQAALDAAQLRYDEAKAEMEAAADEDDTSAFVVAKSTMDEAGTAIEMAKMKLDRLKTKGAVSGEEAAAACSYFKQKLREIDIDAAKKITALMDEIVSIEQAAYSNSISTAKKYASLLKLLGRDGEVITETSTPSRVHDILSQNICLIQDRAVWGNTGKKRLYDLARAGK